MASNTGSSSRGGSRIKGSTKAAKRASNQSNWSQAALGTPF